MFTQNAHAQNPQNPQNPQKPNWHNAILPHAQETTITSSRNHKNYRIQINAIGKEPSEGYPVLYVLDGDMFFPYANALAQTLWQNPNRQNQAVLLVGVGYGSQSLLDLSQRAHDFTPQPRSPQNEFGGADDFAYFLEHELPTHLQKNHKIHQQKQAVFGHSYGGLWVAYRFVNQPTFQFQYYFASSPSLWWDDKRVWDFLPNSFADLNSGSLKAEQSELHISAGSLEQAAAHDTRRQSRDMLGNAQNFNQKINELGAKSTFTLYDDENHGSAGFRALHQRLKFLNNVWGEK